MIQCLNSGGKLWLYTGSVQTLEYNMISELKRYYLSNNQEKTNREICSRARDLLKAFTSDKHWLSSLAGKGDVFHSNDPEDEQLIRALERFPENSIKLLTRDRLLLEEYPDKTISTEQCCQLDTVDSQCSFVDPRPNRIESVPNSKTTCIVFCTTANTFSVPRSRNWNGSLLNLPTSSMRSPVQAAPMPFFCLSWQKESDPGMPFLPPPLPLLLLLRLYLSWGQHLFLGVITMRLQ